jgi:hypothetical protein
MHLSGIAIEPTLLNRSSSKGALIFAASLVYVAVQKMVWCRTERNGLFLCEQNETGWGFAGHGGDALNVEGGANVIAQAADPAPELVKLGVTSGFVVEQNVADYPICLTPAVQPGFGVFPELFGFAGLENVSQLKDFAAFGFQLLRASAPAMKPIVLFVRR